MSKLDTFNQECILQCALAVKVSIVEKILRTICLGKDELYKVNRNIAKYHLSN